MMTQSEYLSRLETLLTDLPEQRKWEILDDIRRHFDEGIALGLPEEELAQSLGAPELLAREYQGIYDQPASPRPAKKKEPSASPKPRRRGRGGKLLRGTGLFFLDLCLALPLLIAAWATWFSLWMTGVALGLAGLLSSVVAVLYRFLPFSWLMVAYPLFTFFAGLSISALGILLAMAMAPLGRGLWRFTGGFFRWNGQVMRGRERYAE